MRELKHPRYIPHNVLLVADLAIREDGYSPGVESMNGYKTRR
jgi:hypothetical protein